MKDFLWGTSRFDINVKGLGVGLARLRIDVERQDTDHRRVQQYQGTRLSDTPGGHTPIERDAATTRSQNTVWARVRRDRTLERALLDELQERVSPPPSNPPDGPMPSSKSAEG